MVVAEIISELEEVDSRKDEDLSPQLLVAVMNKLECSEELQQYVPRCLKVNTPVTVRRYVTVPCSWWVSTYARAPMVRQWTHWTA